MVLQRNELMIKLRIFHATRARNAFSISASTTGESVKIKI